MPRYPQMKTFTDQEALRDHLEALGMLLAAAKKQARTRHRITPT